jgi:hypothetical protein
MRIMLTRKMDPDPPMSRGATSTRAPISPGATTVTPSNRPVSSRPHTTQTRIWTQVTGAKEESDDERERRHQKELHDSIQNIAAERKKERDRLEKRSKFGSAVSAPSNQQDNDTSTVW